MNKKILSIIAIAILILICIIAPNVKATTGNQNDKNPQAIFSHITENGKNYDIIAVLLQPQDVSKIIKSVNRRNTPDNEFNNLTKSDVVDMCETKYKIGTISNIYKVNEENQAIGIVESDTDKVGTGYVIELTNRKKLTVVLYGDVNGDGIIDSKDSLSISKHNVNSEKITDKFKYKAAKLTSGAKNGELNSRDSLRLAYYNIGLIGTDSSHGYKLIDDELLPENDIRTVDFDSIIEDEVNKLSEDANFKLEYTKPSEQINIQVKNRAQKTAEIENTNISYLLENILKTGQVKTLTIKSEKSQVLKLNENESLENIKSEIKEWLANNTQTIFEKNDFNNLINGDFAGKTLTVTIELADGLNYNDGLTSRDYKIKFTANPITVKLECDKKQFNSITLDSAGLIPENQIPKDEVIIAEDGISYKILGWTLQGDSTSKYFDFKTNRVDYDITLKADIIKIVDIDKDINNLVEAFNQTETGKNIFNLSTEESNKTIKVNFVTTKDKLLKEIDIEGLIQSLKEEINKEEVSEIAISNYVLNKETAQEDIKAKLLETLASNFGTTSDEIKLSDLVGKTINVTIKLNEDKAIFDDNANERNYNIKFDDNWAPEIELETVDFDSVIEGEVNKLSEDANFKLEYTKPSEQINIQVKNRAQKTVEVESSNISQILENILKSDKIKTLTIKYENEELLTLDANESLDSIREKIKKSLTDNLQTISGRDDYNNLINGDFVGKTFAIVVELKNNMQFDNGLISREYKVVFKADSIIVTLECDKKQFDNITLENAGLIPEDKIPKDEVIIAEDGTSYKILGWTLKGQSTPTYFDFKTNRVDYDITLKADLRKITDLDKEINKAVNVLNTTETVKDIFNLSMQENSRTINADIIAKKDQNIEEIISENILQGFVLELKKAEISEIKIADYILTKETVSKENFKTELLQNIAKALEINSDQIKLSDLVGKTLNITVNLKKDIAIFDDSTYERNYNIKFDEDWKPEKETVTVDFDSIIEQKINELSEDTNFKMEYTKSSEQIKIHIQNRTQKTSEMENTNISKILEKILQTEQIKTLTIKYGELQPLQFNAKDSLENINIQIKNWITNNIQTISTRNDINNLINGDFAGKTFTATVELIDGFRLDNKDYKIVFEANPITVKLECDKGKFDDITLNNAGLIPDNQIPSEAITLEDGTKYRILGWIMQDSGSQEYFNFKEDRVDNDITLKADIRKIVDINKSLKNMIDIFNKTEIGTTIFSLSMPDTSKTIEVNYITEEDKLLNEIESEELVKAVISALNKEEVSGIVISNHELNKENVTEENLKEKVIEILADVLEINSNKKIANSSLNDTLKTETIDILTDVLRINNTEIKFSNLVGKNLDVTLKLNKDKAIFDDDSYERIYNVKFDQDWKTTVDISSEVEDAVNIASDNTNFTITKEEEQIKIHVQNRAQKTLSMEGSNILKASESLLKSDKIKALEIKYGNTQSLELNSNNIKSQITEWLTKNVQNIFGRTNLDDLINGDFAGKTFTLTVKLADGMQLADKSTSKEYNVAFSADPITVTFECDQKQYESITLDNAGLIPENKRPSNETIYTNDGDYKIIGWFIKESAEQSKPNSYFDFDKNRVDSNITLKADTRKIIDVDTDIKNIVDGFKQTDLFNFSMDKGSKTVKVNIVTTRDQLLNEVDADELIQGLITEIKKEEVSSIEVFDYVISSEATKENIKTKLIEKLASNLNTNSSNIKLSDLIGRQFTAKVKLNQAQAVFDDGKFERDYKINFGGETNKIDKNTFIQNFINQDLSNIDGYDIKYENNNNIIPVTVKHSNTNLNREQGLINIFKKLSQNEQIEEINLIYGEDNIKKPLSNLIANNNLGGFFYSNWNSICSCGSHHSWGDATNECLINAKSNLKLEIKLNKFYGFSDGSNSVQLDFKFNRDTVKTTLHLRNGNTKIITVSEGLPLNKESINQQLPIYGGYEFKAWYSDSSKQHEYTFTEKVTSDIDLYGAWYTILNIDNDIAYTIHYTAQANNDNDGVLDETIKDTVRETVSKQNILTKIFDVTKDKSTLLNTAFAKTLKSELGKEGVISIKVSVTGGATYTFYNSVIPVGEATKQKLLSDLCNNTSKLENVIGKNLKIEITVDNSIVKVNGKQGTGKNTTLTYKVEFKRLITKKQVTEFGTSLFSLVNNNPKVKLSARSDGNLQATVTRAYNNSLATDVADGCGGKTALQDFFNKSGYFKSLEFWASSYSNRATLNFDSLGFWDIIDALYDIPKMLGGSDESKISEFDGKYLNCKEILKDDCIYENGRSLVFKIYFNVEK